MVRLEIQGLEELNKYLVELPEKVDKELSKGNELFMKKVQKSAKLRAPRDTGRLAESIHLRKTITKGKSKQWKIIADSPHAIFQELGFKPHRFTTDPGRPGFATNKLPLGQTVLVKKNTPFLIPALDANAQQLDSMLNKSLGRALK